MAYEKKDWLPLLLIFLTVFIDLVGFGIIIPVLPTFAEEFGAKGFTIGLLLMSYSLMQFLCTPFWGRLSDKVGRRPILLSSLAISGIGYCIWGMAGSLSLLFLSRVVAGAGNANLAVAQAYISDITTPTNRAKGMGLIGAAFGLGFVIGPAIGGFISILGHHAIGFVAAGFSFLDFILTLFCLPEPVNRSQAAHEKFGWDFGFYLQMLGKQDLRIPLLIVFISAFAFANMEATLVLLTERSFHFGPSENSWMFTYIGVVMVCVQGGLIGRLSKRFREKYLVSGGTALIALGLLLTITKQIPTFYLALALLAVGSGINTPANQSILSKLAQPKEVGGVLGVGQSLSALGRILGPLVGGAAFQYVSLESPYIVGAVAMLLAFVLSLILPANVTVAKFPETTAAEGLSASNS